jgi:hypothetical protein
MPVPAPKSVLKSASSFDPRTLWTWFTTNDPLNVLMRRTCTPAGLGLFVFFCAFPVLGHLISRLSKERPWLNDYEAILCAATHMAQGQSPYGAAPVCAGMSPAPYVYAPQIAQVLAPLTRVFSVEALRFGYVLVLVPLIALGIGLIFTRNRGDGFRRLSLMSLTAMGGGAMASGNIGFVLLGMILIGVLLIDKSPLPFVISVLLATLIKPVYLGFLLVLLYREGALRQRLISFVSLAAAGIGLTAMIWLNAGPLYDEWQDSLRNIALEQQPGIGFFALTSAMGLTGTHPLALIAYGLFAITIGLGGLYLAEKTGLSNRDRILLGLGAALLINPRLMDYDMAPLGPFMAMLLLKVRADFGLKVFAPLAWAYAVPLCICLLANMLEIETLHRAPFAVLAFALITLRIIWLYGQRDLKIMPPARLKVQP